MPHCSRPAQTRAVSTLRVICERSPRSNSGRAVRNAPPLSQNRGAERKKKEQRAASTPRPRFLNRVQSSNAPHSMPFVKDFDFVNAF